jgi:hypothetical protein
LDNGYQGDGEWSHLASRGADHSLTNHRVIKLKTSGADPMTNSDFFTESDAGTHDDMCAGTGHGDGRAQVIDGTLYGTNLHAGQQQQRCPSFTASIKEEMESSGVYFETEKRPKDATSDGKDIQGEEQNPGEENFSPDGSTKTVSSRSGQSQIKQSSLTRSPSKSLRKNGGRRDAVMNKIARGQAEQKLKSRSLKEVKSKVFTNITSSPGEGVSRRIRKTNSSSLGLSVSARALKENSPHSSQGKKPQIPNVPVSATAAECCSMSICGSGSPCSF